MPRGGRRAGAGRKPGSLTTRTREIAERAAEDGVTPLEHMLAVMRDPKAALERRDAMAKAAAPYIHPSLASIRHGGEDGGPVKIERIERVIIDTAD
jgi:hypothetical protein